MARAPRVKKQPIIRHYDSIDPILFPVSKLPMMEATGLNGYHDHAFAIVAELPGLNGKGTLLNTCSKVYRLKPNSEIFPRFNQILSDNGLMDKTKIQVDVIRNSRFYVKYGLPNYSAFVGKPDDIIIPQIEIDHSYDGKGNFGLYFGLHRQICSNGLTVPFASKHQFDMVVKHTDKMEEVFIAFMRRIQAFCLKFSSQEILKDFQPLVDRKVKDPIERIQHVYANFGSFPKKNLEIAETVIQREMKALGYNIANDWLVYNAMNEALFNDECNKHPEVKRKLDQQILNALILNELPKKPEKKKVLVSLN